MAASTFMPDITVEIAFNSGYLTPAASRVWTDVSNYVEAQNAIDITRGRADEFGDVSPSTCSVTLDNKDGRFTPKLTGGAYYPNVKKGRPIRVTAVWPLGGGGTTYRRFTGYVDEWPVDWEDPGAEQATTTITASSRQARLGLTDEMRSVIESEYLLDSPYAYFTMADPAEVTAATNSSAVTTWTMAQAQAGSGGALVFGNAVGPTHDDLTAVELDRASQDNGKYLRRALPVTITSSSSGYLAIEAWIVSTTNTGTIFTLGTPDTEGGAYLTVYNALGDVACQVAASGGGGFSLVGSLSPVMHDGGVHHVVVTLEPNAGNHRTRLYFDGVQVATNASGCTPAIFDLLVKAGSSFRAGASPFGDLVWDGTLAHLALYTTELTASRIAEHYDAGATGFEGETSGEWIERLATYAGIPSAEVSAETGNTTSIAAVRTAGKSAIEVMQDVAKTEGGVVFDAGDGTLTFHARGHRWDATSAVTLSATTQQITAGLQPKLDDQGMVNDLTVTLISGYAARVVNQDSIDDYGRYSDTVELLTTSEAEAEDRANWGISKYGEPGVRIPNASTVATVLSSSTLAALLDLEIGDRITLAGLPSQAPATSMDFFIEGYTENITINADQGESWVMTFNLSPAEQFDVWVCEDATFGAFDEFPIAY